MILYKHYLNFSLLSSFNEIENVDFFDWDWNWNCFWRIITSTYSTIFNFFLTIVLYSRIVFSKWTFFSIAFFCKTQLSQNVEAHFRSMIKNFSTNIVSKSKKFLMSKIRIRFLRFSQFVIQFSIVFIIIINYTRFVINLSWLMWKLLCKTCMKKKSWTKWKILFFLSIERRLKVVYSTCNVNSFINFVDTLFVVFSW
jgi:hypothetical protein